MQAWTKVVTVKVEEKQIYPRDLGGRVLSVCLCVFCECDSTQFFNELNMTVVSMQYWLFHQAID